MQNQKAELRTLIRGLPQCSGVYLMKDRLGHVIYVGKAKNLKRRVSSYFQGSRRFVRAQPKIAAMVEMVCEISIHKTKNETEALLLEGKLIKEYKPRYNTDFTDDKQFLLVRVDLQNDLPKFRLCRNKKEDGAHYFGPFAQAGFLRSTLSEMRKKFGILLSDARPEKLEDGRYRLYDDARAEIFAGHNETTLEEYKERVEEACSFLEGKAKSWLAELREKMKVCAESMDFERAAEFRDLADALSKTIKKTRRFDKKWPRTMESSWEGLERIRETLDLDRPPNVIECFDISHVSGTFVVASMVRFVSGKSDRRSYRRYKIKSFKGNDDFRAMEEVVGRRYGRLLRAEREFPDLVVIDGGAGQVSSAIKAFYSLEISPPPLIGLAKREESIVFPDERADLVLDSRDLGLRLLQQVRDEAHRFANQFNADLRSKRIKESILDDFKGLGEGKKLALLGHFGSIEKLRNAGSKEIQEIDGVGPKLADRLHEFLNFGKDA